MTVQSTDRTAGPFIGNGVQTAFPFSFRVFQASDLLATVVDTVGNSTELVLSSDYVVMLNADQDTSPGGTLAMLAPLASGYTLELTSDLEATQQLALTTPGGFYPGAITNALDKLTILLQQQGVFGRSALRVPESSGVPALPAAAARANKFLAFDSAGNPLLVVGIDSGSAAALQLLLADTAVYTRGAGMVGLNQTLAYAAYTAGNFFAGLPWSPCGPAFGARFDGVTDDTAAINACATACRAATPRKAMMIPLGKAKFSATLDFSGIPVKGQGRYESQLLATSATFDCIKTTGDSILSDFYVDGGWNGSSDGSALTSGDIIHIENPTASYPYNVHLDNLRLVNAKRDLVYMKRGGYSSLSRVLANAAGRHGLHMVGNSGSDATTTVSVDGQCVFSDLPFGFNARLQECISILIAGVYENGKGFELAGNDNRNLQFIGAHQEGNTTGNYITFTGSGSGLYLQSNYALGFALPYSSNWSNVEIGRSNTMNLPASAPGWRMHTAPTFILQDGGEQTINTTGGHNFVAVIISIPPGIWDVDCYMQVANGTGATLLSAGIRLTTNSAENYSGLTGTGFIVDEDGDGAYGNQQSRPAFSTKVQNTTGTSQNYYLKGYVNISAGSVKVQGYVRGVRVG